MNNKTIFYHDGWKLAKRSFGIFFLAYSIFMLIVIVTSFSYFAMFLPILIFLFFLLTKRLLLAINIKNDVEIEFIFLKFLLVKKNIVFRVDETSYLYQLERTSRLAENFVFRVFQNGELIFSRYHDLDGINDYDVEQIISRFKLLGIREES